MGKAGVESALAGGVLTQTMGETMNVLLEGRREEEAYFAERTFPKNTSSMSEGCRLSALSSAAGGILLSVSLSLKCDIQYTFDDMRS